MQNMSNGPGGEGTSGGGSGSGGGGGGGGNRRGGRGRSNAPTVVVSVPAAKVGSIIGKGGETIHIIQDISRARVSVQPESKDNPAFRKVNIIGSQKTIDHARHIIDELIAGNTAVLASGGDPAFGGRPGMGQKLQKVIRIPLDRIGLVIGRGGEGIRAISLQCRVHITVDPNPVDGKRDITIIADTEEQINKTLEAIDERITTGGKANVKVAVFRQNADPVANDLLNGVTDPLEHLWELDLSKQFNTPWNHVHGGFNSKNTEKNLDRLINVDHKFR